MAPGGLIPTRSPGFLRCSTSFPRMRSRETTGARGSARPARLFARSLQAVSHGDDQLAAHSLDLAGIPTRARSDIGPTLARKLKFVLDVVGPVRLQEIPNDIEGPRHILYRGPIGRISLTSAVDGPREGRLALHRRDGGPGRADVPFRPRQTATGRRVLRTNGRARTRSRRQASGCSSGPRCQPGRNAGQWPGALPVDRLVPTLLVAGGLSWLAFRTLDFFLVIVLRTAARPERRIRSCQAPAAGLAACPGSGRHSTWSPGPAGRGLGQNASGDEVGLDRPVGVDGGPWSISSWRSTPTASISSTGAT